MSTADYLCGVRAASGPERGPANIHAAVGGGLKDAVKLTEGVVKEEQGHPLLDICHEGAILWREPEDAGVEAVVPRLAVGHEDGARHVGGVLSERTPGTLEPHPALHRRNPSETLNKNHGFG